jgi:hypothetical protein
VAITTLNGVLAGMQVGQFFAKAGAGATLGKPTSFWAVGGAPGAGSFNGSLTGGTYSSTGGLVAGQIPHVDPPSGNAYLARFSCSVSAAPGIVMLCDRLWDNGGFTITSNTAQSLPNSVPWPARDATGTTNGVGVVLGVEISATVGAATPTITVGYTNSSGTAGRSASNIDPTTSAAGTNAFFRIGLQAGDVGVQSVQNLTLSASWVSGTMNLVAYRVLATVEIPVTAYTGTVDALTSGFPQIFNGTVPFLIFTGNVGVSSGLIGQYIETQG